MIVSPGACIQTIDISKFEVVDTITSTVAGETHTGTLAPGNLYLIWIKGGDDHGLFNQINGNCVQGIFRVSQPREYTIFGRHDSGTAAAGLSLPGVDNGFNSDNRGSGFMSKEACRAGIAQNTATLYRLK
ncbi:MAG: hypothetical protein LBL52_01535 [Rickettsiales bacterium]|jgi:hypothetical protein|nr:hypothetical protein [Rickettsiales bacterium]